MGRPTGLHGKGGNSVGTVTRQQPIVLDYNAEGQVLVKPADDDLFLTSVQRAAEACQMANKALAFGSQFHGLLNRLAGWIRDHQKQITHAYVTLRDGGFLFLVVQKRATIDMEFEKELTGLDLAVANEDKFDLLRLNVLGLPACTKDCQTAFVYTDETWVFQNAP
jgi:hypothetical protein